MQINVHVICTHNNPGGRAVYGVVVWLLDW